MLRMIIMKALVEVTENLSFLLAVSNSALFFAPIF